MFGKARLIFTVLSLVGGFGVVWGESSTAKPNGESHDQSQWSSVNVKSTNTAELQLSEESLRAFSIKPNAQQQQSPKLAPPAAKLAEPKDTAPKVPTSPIAKLKPRKFLHVELATSLGDEYSLDELDDSTIRFRVTHSKDLASCTGILRRIGQSDRFEGQVTGVFRNDPSQQARFAPITIELTANERTATVRTDYITWDRYGYETSRRSCVFQAVCH